MGTSCLSVLPQRLREVVEPALAEDDEEIRIGAGRPVMLIGNGRRMIDIIATREDCDRLLELACSHSVFAYERELKECYVTLEDGSRVGMAGKLTTAGMTMPHSFNIRLARQVRGAADQFIKLICNERIYSALLLSEPGAGKTTVLRDTARQLSCLGYKVSIADERGEIAAAVKGVPMLDVGYADVMGGCKKAKGMALLIRGMSPQILITDEISSREDANAILDASGCGVKVIASAHGSDKGVLRRQGIGEAIKAGAFDRILLLKKDFNGRSIEDITGEVICGY